MIAFDAGDRIDLAEHVALSLRRCHSVALPGVRSARHLGPRSRSIATSRRPLGCLPTRDRRFRRQARRADDDPHAGVIPADASTSDRSCHAGAFSGGRPTPRAAPSLPSFGDALGWVRSVAHPGASDFALWVRRSGFCPLASLGSLRSHNPDRRLRGARGLPQGEPTKRTAQGAAT